MEIITNTRRKSGQLVIEEENPFQRCKIIIIFALLLFSLSFSLRRSNLLTSLPRELCFLPIEVLLVSNNRLAALPDELGRMEQLTELDAACNQITHLPARMSDLKNLKSLSLRNNQLVYLPRGRNHTN